MYPSMMHVPIQSGAIPSLTTNILRVRLGYTLISNGQPITHVLTHHAILELVRGNNLPMPTWTILVTRSLTSTKAMRQHTIK
jgi:hypothetical protein